MLHSLCHPHKRRGRKGKSRTEIVWPQNQINDIMFSEHFWFNLILPWCLPIPRFKFNFRIFYSSMHWKDNGTTISLQNRNYLKPILRIGKNLNVYITYCRFSFCDSWWLFSQAKFFDEREGSLYTGKWKKDVDKFDWARALINYPFLTFFFVFQYSKLEYSSYRCTLSFSSSVYIFVFKDDKRLLQWGYICLLSWEHFWVWKVWKIEGSYLREDRATITSIVLRLPALQGKFCSKENF